MPTPKLCRGLPLPGDEKDAKLQVELLQTLGVSIKDFQTAWVLAEGKPCTLADTAFLVNKPADLHGGTVTTEYAKHLGTYFKPAESLPKKVELLDESKAEKFAHGIIFGGYYYFKDTDG